MRRVIDPRQVLEVQMRVDLSRRDARMSQEFLHVGMLRWTRTDALRKRNETGVGARECRGAGASPSTRYALLPVETVLGATDTASCDSAGRPVCRSATPTVTTVDSSCAGMPHSGDPMLGPLEAGRF